MTEVSRVNVQFGSTIWGTAKTQNADAPRRDCSDSSFSMPEETGRGLTSCQRLQGDRPSATFSSTKELLWANENIHCPELSQTGLLPKSELSLLSKKSLDPTLWTTMSQEYTERVQLISVARMASVANTFPWVFASCRQDRREK